MNGEIVGIGDAYQQSFTTMKIIQSAIEDLGGKLTDIVRIRIFVTDGAHVPELGRAAQDFGMADIMPTATLIVVKSLIDPRLLVEIEVDAIVDEA